ncbi:MAG: hypothetical protein HZC37_27435 [Burkholderiales bacterium]|nr:hypothetical protein [Burkholderiales bacterium]
MPTPKPYRVIYVEWSTRSVVVEAEDEHDAEEIALDMREDEAYDHLIKFENSGLDGVEVEPL